MIKKNATFTVERDGLDYDIIFKWIPETYTWKIKIFGHHRFTSMTVPEQYVGEPSFEQAFELLTKNYPVNEKGKI